MAGPKSTSTPDDAPIFANPDKFALGLGGGVTAQVIITTKEGSRYEFADMPVEELKRVMPESGRILADQPSLALANVSFVVMTIPFRIIKTIHAGEELLWESPA